MLSWITCPHKKAGLDLTTYIPEKDVMVTPSLPRVKNLDKVGPVDNRPSTNKDGDLKQLLSSNK